MLAAAATAMSGCGSAGASDGSGSDTAALQGKLVLDAGCLYVEAPHGTDWIAAFPVDEVEWEDGKLLYQGSSYVPRDEILLGAGTGNALQGVTEPDSCRGTDVWQVGQTD